MAKFNGFTATETFIPIPESVITQLGSINDLNELKIILYTIWRVNKVEQRIKTVTRAEYALDYDLTISFKSGADLDEALQLAVQDGFLLEYKTEGETYFFLNSPGGNISLQAMLSGEKKEGGNQPAPKNIPNIFVMYEQNIGMLTPLVAQMLKTAEETYTPEWVADALQVAVKMNKRNMKYIEAILRRWKEEGRDEKSFRSDSKKSGSGDESRRKFEEFLRPKNRK